MTKFLTFIALLGGGVLSIAQTTLKPSVFIDTKSAGSFNFIVKNSGKCLKEMREFIGNEKIVRNKPILSLKNLFRKKD